MLYTWSLLWSSSCKLDPDIYSIFLGPGNSRNDLQFARQLYLSEFSWTSKALVICRNFIIEFYQGTDIQQGFLLASCALCVCVCVSQTVNFVPFHDIKKLLSKCPSSDSSWRHICISMPVVPILICRAISHLANLLRNECLATFFLDKGTEMDLLPSHSFLRNHTSVSLIIFDCTLSFFWWTPIPPSWCTNLWGNKCWEIGLVYFSAPGYSMWKSIITRSIFCVIYVINPPRVSPKGTCVVFRSSH